MTAPIDVLAVMDLAYRHLNGGADGLTGREHMQARAGMKGARAAIAELIEAANAVAGPQVGISPRDRKLHALRAALANVSGTAGQ